MISFLFGLAAVALGLSGIWIWHVEFFQFIKGAFPVSFFFAGVVAILTGISGIIAKHRSSVDKPDNGKE